MGFYSIFSRESQSALEYARIGFFFMAAKIYNKLPLNIRTQDKYKDFEKSLNEYYS